MAEGHQSRGKREIQRVIRRGGVDWLRVMRTIAAGRIAVAVLVLVGAACTRSGRDADASSRSAAGAPRLAKVRLGVSVLLDDSGHLIRGKRVGLLTNHTGIDERGQTTVELLTSDARATALGVKVVALLVPEHGLAGTEDRTNLPGGRDPRTGIPMHSLYGAATIAPPDSALRDLDAIVVDLQDIGTRTWTYVGVMVYAMRAGARRGLPVLVLDRPNPITGSRSEGPLLDSTLANPNDPSPTRPGRAFALYPLPLRHGMTVGELARYYNETIPLRAELTVIPMSGWRRSLWFDQTTIPWVRPSPNMPSLASALTYPALVAFESSNVSVGRGTDEAFQRLGAPWMRAKPLADMLNARELVGIRFEPFEFTPQAPTDGKYGGRKIPGLRLVVTDRDRVQVSRVGAALLWAIARLHSDSLRLDSLGFDLRFGAPSARRALLRGDDPDEVIDRELPAAMAVDQRARRFRIYR